MAQAATDQKLDVTLRTIPMDLRPHLNNQGATRPDRPDTGRLNVWRNSLPADGRPISTSCDGVVLHSVPLTGGSPDNVLCRGQVVELPGPVRADWTYLLCCAERRSRATLTYYFDDGSSCEQPWLVSDLWEGEAAFGEQPAHRSGAIHYPHHVQPGIGITLWVQRVPVPPRLPLTALRLPRTANVHVFSAVLVSTWAGDRG